MIVVIKRMCVMGAHTGDVCDRGDKGDVCDGTHTGDVCDGAHTEDVYIQGCV